MELSNQFKQQFGQPLSREELKNFVGGNQNPEDGGYALCVRACGTGGRGHGDPCVMTTCEPGTCGYHGTAFWGCG